MEYLKCIERIIKKLDDLIEFLVENESLHNLGLEEFLNNCFQIIKDCDVVDNIYFSNKLSDNGYSFPIGLKDEIIGYVVITGCPLEVAQIIAQNLKYVVFIFLSFRELYSSISELKYIGVKFEAYRRAFYDISRAILSSVSEEVILKIICQITQELVMCSACLIFFRNKVIYTTSNKLIEQELNFVIPELKSKIDKKLDVFYSDGEIINIESAYLKHLKNAFIRRFNVPIVGQGSFVLLFTSEVNLSSVDLDFVSTVTAQIASAIETRNLFEQLAIKNTFLEKLFIGSTRLSEVASFEDLYHILNEIIRDIFNGHDFVIFHKSKGEVFKPAFIRISNPKLYNFVEASEISMTIISEHLYQIFASYKSLIVFKDDDYKNDFVRFLDLIFQRPYIVIPILEKGNIRSLVVFNINYQFLVNYQGIVDILFNHLSILFSYVFSRVSAYEKLLSKSNENKIINRVIYEYSSIRDINVLISSIVKEIRNLVFYSLPVFTYYKNGQLLVIKTIEYYKSLVLTVVNNLPSVIMNKIKQSVELVNKGIFKPILINNIELFFDNINIYDFVKKSDLKSLLILPMKAEISEFQPVLLVFSLSNRFDQEYVDLLYSLNNHFSIFLENAFIYSFLEERLKVTDILYNFLRIVTSVLDPNNVIMNTKEFIDELIKPELLVFIIKKYHNFELSYIKPNNLSIDYNSIIKTLGFLGSNTVNINSKNILIDKNYKKIWGEITKTGINIKNIFIIPIVYLREILGYIILGIDRENISESLSLILNNIPYALATPLKNSMIMQDQVEISNIIRKALITKIDNKKSLGKRKIELFYKHVASREITADWIEVISKKDSLIVIVADVSGKGAKSAIYTAQAKFAAKSLFFSLDNFNLAINQLNKILSSTVEDETFITMLAINIYSKNDKLYCEYLNAGHEPLIIIKNNGKILNLSTLDIPLCIDRSYEYKSSIQEIEENDVLFLYTDGVVDIKDENGNNFGRDRLINTIKNVYSENIKTLTDKIYVEVMKFSSSPLSNPPDDITLVFLKII